MVPYISNWLLLYPIALTLFVGLQISQVAVDGRRLTITTQLLRSAVFLMFVFAFLAIGVRSSALSFIWFAILSVFSIVLLIKRGRLNRSAVAMTALACRNEYQIRQVVDSFYSDERRLLGRRLKRLKRMLDGGAPWVRAFEVSGIFRGSYERLAARLVERFGMLRTTSSDLNAPLRIENELERLLSRTSVVIWVVLFVPVFLFFRLVVFPSLLRMLEEFELGIPASMQLLGATGPWIWISDLAGLLLLVLCVLAGLVWLVPSLSAQRPLRWLSEPYYRSLGFVALARVSERTDNLVTACQQVADLVSVKFISQRFRVASDMLLQGMSPGKAFAASGLAHGKLLDQFVSIMDTSGIAWATHQLATTEVERMLNRYSVIIQCFVIGFTLYFSLLIGLNAYGLFESLAALVFAIEV